MKKIILSFSILLASSIAIMGQTATDFTVTDCAGTSHHLFAELDAGKVVVIVWVMPCPSCIGPAKSAYNTAQTFQSSYPGRVLFYLVDDLGDTQCSTLNTWGNSNAMPNAVKFSNATISMDDYGTPGMPKVVVLGGGAHTVFDNENDAFNSTAISNAITSALAAPSSVNENSISGFELTVFPNSATTSLKVAYTLQQAEDISFVLYNILGEKVKTSTPEKQTPGRHQTQLSTESFSAGVYFIQLKTGNGSEIRKFTITR